MKKANIRSVIKWMSFGAAIPLETIGNIRFLRNIWFSVFHQFTMYMLHDQINRCIDRRYD